MTKHGGEGRALYTPEAIAAMNRAYDEVCGRIRAAGASHDAQVKAGEHIMFLARSGITDERRMCDLAIQKALGTSH